MATQKKNTKTETPASAAAKRKRPARITQSAPPVSPAPPAAQAHTVSLGKRIRSLRRSRDWSLNQLAEASGIAPSTLSKVENDILTLNYDRLAQVAAAFDMGLSEFLAEPRARQNAARTVMARRSLFRHDQGEIVNTPNYEYRYLCTDLAVKGMVPIFSVVHARSLEEFGPLLHHEGEELVFVVKGRITVHTEFYKPEVLEELQGVYIDSTMGHAYVNSGEGDAWILSVNTGAIAASKLLREANDSGD